MISITVPVYNTSKYLRRCLDSLAAQTLKDIEFILVDDGSTDGSDKICDEYTANDSRFRSVHQRNGGLAAARQTGLAAAKGAYIIVCDSDDWVEPDIYEKLYQKAKETDADIVCCGYFAEYNDGRSIPKQTIFEERDGIVDNIDFLKRGANSSWVKLVRRSLFERTDSFYEPGINLSEDSLIVYKLMRGNPKVVQIRENLYHYRRLFGEESYTNSIKMAHIHQLCFTYNWLKDNFVEDRFEPIRFSRAIDLAFACLRAKDIDELFLHNFMKSELSYYRFINNYKFKSLKSIFVLIEKTFPLYVAKSILNLTYKFIYK